MGELLGADDALIMTPDGNFHVFVRCQFFEWNVNSEPNAYKEFPSCSNGYNGWKNAQQLRLIQVVEETFLDHLRGHRFMFFQVSISPLHFQEATIPVYETSRGVCAGK